MTNRQARLIGTGLAMIAGSQLMTTARGDIEVVGNLVFIVAAVFFVHDWLFSLRSENTNNEDN